MLKQYFLSNLLIMVFLNVLVKPAWIFLIDRNVQLTVGHQEYGIYSALFSLTIIFNIVLDFGITNYNNRSIASDSSQIHLSLPNMIVAKGLFSILYFLLIFSIAVLFHYDQRALFLLMLLGGIQFLNSFLQFLRSNVSAHHDFAIDSVLSVLDKLIMILVCGFLLWHSATASSFRIEWYLYAQLFAYLLAILVALVIIIYRYSRIDFRHFNFSDMWLFCRKSLPYALLILLMGVYMRSDSLLLERLRGAHFSSLYAEAYRILDALNMFGFLLAGILLPLFTRLIARKMPVHDIVNSSANIMLSLSLAIAAHSLLYGRQIMFLLDHQADANLHRIYWFVIASFPAYCLMYIYSTLLTANGDIPLLIRMAVSGCVMSIGLNLLLIPHWDALGAALTALLVQVMVATVSVYYCIRKFDLAVSWIRVGKFATLFALVLALNWLCVQMELSLFNSILLNIPVFFALVYLIRLWDWQQLQVMVQQFKLKGR